jgi:hypothetical protein
MEPNPARHPRSAIPALEAALRAALDQRADLRWLDFEPLWRMHRRLRRQGLRERKGK